jgi:CRP-like cAMP-binding protein/HEAT repeat protein
MNAISSRQQQLLDQTRQLLHESETKRRSLRFNRFIRDFAAGKREMLAHPEFAQALGSHLTSLYHKGLKSEAEGIVMVIATCVCDEDPTIRENGVNVLVTFSSSLRGNNNLGISKLLFNTLATWFGCETQVVDGFGLVCSQLHKITQKLLSRRTFWRDAETFLGILQDIEVGRIDKPPAIREMAIKLQESLATRQVLRELVSCYLNDKTSQRASAEKLLVSLGNRAVVHMVNVLMLSDKKEERLQLLKLIPEAGPATVPVLGECLKKNPPWYVIRNIVIIISELNDPGLFHMVQPYLGHRDPRVQQQAISCAARLGSGTLLRNWLIEALEKVDDELKMVVVMQLSRLGGREVTEAFLKLLDARKRFKRETYIELLVKICGGLGNCSEIDAIAALHKLIKERQQHAGPSDPIISAARDALIALKPSYPEEVQEVITQAELSDEEFGSPGLLVSASRFKRSNRSIKDLVEQGDLEDAGKKLFENAVNAARDNDFSSAELLRDKILEISPLALSEVIRLGEIIEEEKSSSISSHHIAIWSELYEKMTTEEFNALYYALNQQRYYTDDTIVNAGQNNPCLYFINSGVIILSCQSNDRDTVLKRLQPGEVVGVSPFFESSVWTVTMTARTESQVYVLSEQSLHELERRYPGIESKLKDYCVKYDTVPELLQMAGSDRRKNPRYPVSVVINNMLLDPYGNVGKRSFKGELIDISRGGLRFAVTISNRENARLLLGRQIVSELVLNDNETLKCFGVIVGGRYQEEDGPKFSVHVNFHRKLEKSSFHRAVNLEVEV